MSGVDGAGGYNLTCWGAWLKLPAWLKHNGPAGRSAGCQAWLNGWLLSMGSQKTVRLSLHTGDLYLHNEKSVSAFCGIVGSITWKTSTLHL